MAEAVHRTGFAPTDNRASKAAKILQILEEASGASMSNWRVLDIGTGTGEISQVMGQRFEVISVDIVDQRSTLVGYDFVVSKEALPFREGCFDAVVSNHVIEHVVDQILHVSEIARVLKPGGVAYLATPNRLWPWEVHYRLPLLHYLPNWAFFRLLRLAGIFTENVCLLTWRELKSVTRPWFAIHAYSDRIIQDPVKYRMACPGWLAVVLKRIPLRLLGALTFWHPTFVVILLKEHGASSGD